MSFVLRLLLLSLITFGIEFYFYSRLFHSVKILMPDSLWVKSRKLRISVITYLNLYLVLAVLYWSYIFATGRSIQPAPESAWFDWLILYPFWIGILALLQSLVFILPLDIVTFPIKFVRKNYYKKLTLNKARIIAAIVLISVIYVPARAIYDYNTVEITSETLEVSQLSDDLNGLKIGFISDIQADWYTSKSKIENYIEKLNVLNPDVVMISGDLITGTPNYIERSAEYLSSIKAPLGVYSSVGDHDQWSYREDNARSRREIREALKKHNIKMLDNENLLIPVGSAELGLSFVTDTYPKRISPDELKHLADKLTGDVKIMVSHQPVTKVVKQARHSNYNAMFSGHTHGGQITFVFPFITLTPTALETKYIRGRYDADGLPIFINSGLGVSLVPLRYNSNPEVTLITL